MRKKILLVLISFCLIISPLYAGGNRWTSKPPVGSQIDWGHPLAQGLVGCWLMNEGGGNIVNDIGTKKRNGTFSGASWGINKNGSKIIHDNTNDNVNFGNSSLILPTQTISIVLKYQKRDATNRQSGAFGMYSGTNRCGVHLPWSDGVVYWDFGGATEDVNRESIAGLTFGNDLWVFTSGGRGMEIWQNGIKRSSNTANPTRTSTTDEFFLGRHTSAFSDLGDYSFLFIFNRQISSSEIKQLYQDPYCFIKPPTIWSMFSTVIAAARRIWAF